ncbi:lysine decarboxylase, partial [Kamptonema animale CS-326]|nr:lysine decarboxylase [Kamptonema animale CS-326]
PLSPSPHLLSPRDAFFATAEVVLVDRACDRISAELICPYPPGIPILIPGEIITQEAVEYLQEVLILGGCITGCSDPTLKTFKVVKD